MCTGVGVNFTVVLSDVDKSYIDRQQQIERLILILSL